MRMMRLPIGFLMAALLVLAPGAHGAALVCDTRVDPNTGAEMRTNCRLVEDGASGGGGGGSSASKPAMMWVRLAIMSGGAEGFVSQCRLWPVDQVLPTDFERASADVCGIEGARPTRADVERMVHSLSASLRVPDPTINLGPEPSANEWNMSVVGLPIWLWTDTPRTASSSNNGGGMTIMINADLDKLVFTMGDGTQVTCSTWTPYTPANAGDPSPTCGHVYSKPSLPKGDYTITATAYWTAQWSAMGYSGTLPLLSSATRTLPVGELQAVVIRSR